MIIWHRGCQPKFFRRAWCIRQWDFRFTSEVTFTKPCEIARAAELWPIRKRKSQLRKEKYESIKSFPKNPNPATFHRTGARRARRVDGRAGDGNA
jgi:hypothetical protein